MVETNFISINEIFTSLQGEGLYSGQPMTFVRVSGCNLACVWCDQPDTISNGYVDREGREWNLVYTKMSATEILNIVSERKTIHVCLTGGEPSAHKLGRLIWMLHDSGYWVHMESNGTKHPDWLEKVDHLVVSPKKEGEVLGSVLELAKELKFIVDDNFDMEWVYRITNHYHGPIYLSAANFQNNVDWTQVKKVMKIVQDNPRFRMTMQMHKILDIK